MSHNNLSEEFPPNTVSDELEAFLVAWLQTLQEQGLLPVPTQLVTTLPDQNPVDEAPPAPTHPFVCPRCDRGFRRPQDRNRHICIHLPYSYHCPFPRCPRRCGRPEDVTKHWNDTHAEYGPAPSRQQSQIYYSKGLVTAVLDGALTVDDAAEIALSVVAIKGIELDKGDVWENGWGRRTIPGQ